MKEYKAVGPNFKTYYYYTNELADSKNVKGVIVIATGMEGTGAVYDEIGEYLASKGYALYTIDELGYGKTGKVGKDNYKNWKRKSFHFAAYNVHALSVLAKEKHPNSPVYLIGNDFGAMLSLYLIREFPEVIDKVVTIGWGTPRVQDFGFLLTSFIRKIFLYDDKPSKVAHFSKNKTLRIRFEREEKYAWLSSDLGQIKKIKEAGYLDTPGTVGHYFFYFLRKIRTPLLMRLKQTDRTTPMLFISGDKDLLTLRGRKTKGLERYYKIRKFTNVESLILSGRHELLFEANRFENMDIILNWLNNNEAIPNPVEEEDIAIKKTNIEVLEQNQETIQEQIETEEINPIVDIEVEEVIDTSSFLEAEDDLLISTNKEEK